MLVYICIIALSLTSAEKKSPRKVPKTVLLIPQKKTTAPPQTLHISALLLFHLHVYNSNHSYLSVRSPRNRPLARVALPTASPTPQHSNSSHTLQSEIIQMCRVDPAQPQTIETNPPTKITLLAPAAILKIRVHQRTRTLNPSSIERLRLDAPVSHSIQQMQYCVLKSQHFSVSPSVSISIEIDMFSTDIITAIITANG